MAAPWWDSDGKDRRSSWEYRCYVRNLPYGATEAALLEDSFSEYGPVSSQVVIDHETGRSRGFGFVQFASRESMESAIQGMEGQQIGGRNVTVREAYQRPRRRRA